MIRKTRKLYCTLSWSATIDDCSKKEYKDIEKINRFYGEVCGNILHELVKDAVDKYIKTGEVPTIKEMEEKLWQMNKI